MNKLLLLLVFLCLYPLTNEAQETNYWSNYPSYGIMQYNVLSPIDNLSAEQYYNPNFQAGLIVTKKHGILKVNGIRYNVADDEIECLIKKQHSTINFPKRINEVKIADECFEYKKFVVHHDSTYGYLNKIFDGKWKIYVRYSKKHKKGSSLKSIYLLEDGGNIPVKVASPQIILSRKFKDLQNQAYAYIKTNQLHWNQIQDVKKLFHYLQDLESNKVASR
ncbi:hypothetical protein [Ancylomarina longa]|uniref:DUF4468 domain-containing protein n=1 Tax=Ancylomarina longa TaxID=2487017 RepID=A0A434AF09_9BACT|nr:hypothetical protein [Ancylomarina longa]RUT73001.1 hypothetical protein DLK05_15645 [Ancylomarina longa]